MSAKSSKPKPKPTMAKPAVKPKQPLLSDSYLADYARMMTNPKDNEPVRTPSEFATTGDIKTFTRVFSLEAGSVPNQSFAMVVNPTIEDFFQLTKDVGITSPNAMQAVSPDKLTFVANPVTRLDEANASFVISDSVTQVTLGAVETTMFQGKASLVVSTPPGQPVNMRLSNGNNGSIFTLFYWDPVTLAWVIGGSQSALGYTQVGLGFVPVNGCGALCLQSSRLSLGCTASLTVPVGSTFGALSQSYNLFNSDAIQLGQVERYRVVALSLLASYSGNQFNDGGVIAAARCQAGYVFGDDPYSSLTKLVDHQYHGPMKTGAYVWWLPNSFAEREYLLQGQTPPSATNLRIAGNFSDPDGSLQITITTVIEFYSPLQIFSHIIGPVVSEAFYAALHALDSIPAATCNPLHTDLLKLLGKSLKKAVGFAASNPALVQQAVKALAAMA